MLFDTHTHVQCEDYDADREAVLARAREGNVWMVNVGTDLDASRKAVALAHAAGEGVFASVGLHPNEITDNLQLTTDNDAFDKLARDPKAVAIGECGLDYYRTTEKERQKLQKDIFLKHIELAGKLKKPLIIHCREAHRDLLDILHSTYYLLPSTPGVMHFFGGTGAWEHLDAYLAMGFYISFAGVVTFSTYTHTEEIKRVPLERLVVETDAPYATPAPFRGTRNEPAFVRYAVEKLAHIRGLSFEAMAEQTTKNARALFSV